VLTAPSYILLTENVQTRSEYDVLPAMENNERHFCSCFRNGSSWEVSVFTTVTSFSTNSCSLQLKTLQQTQFREPVSMPPKCSNNVMRLRHLYQAVTLFHQMKSKLISCNCEFDSKSWTQAFLAKVLVYDLARASQTGKMIITA
jgi:hypothetical protein